MDELRRVYIIPVHNHVELLIVVIYTTKRVNHVQGQHPTQVRGKRNVKNKIR